MSGFFYLALFSRFSAIPCTVLLFIASFHFIVSMYQTACQRMFGLFPFIGYNEECCYEHSVFKFYVHFSFNSLGNIPRTGIAASYGNATFNFLRNCQIVFHSDCSISHSHQQSKGLNFSISSPTLGIIQF